MIHARVANVAVPWDKELTGLSYVRAAAWHGEHEALSAEHVDSSQHGVPADVVRLL